MPDHYVLNLVWSVKLMSCISVVPSWGFTGSRGNGSGRQKASFTTLMALVSSKIRLVQPMGGKRGPGNLVDIQGSPPPDSRARQNDSGKNARRPLWINKELQAILGHKNEA